MSVRKINKIKNFVLDYSGGNFARIVIDAEIEVGKETRDKEFFTNYALHVEGDKINIEKIKSSKKSYQSYYKLSSYDNQSFTLEKDNSLLKTLKDIFLNKESTENIIILENEDSFISSDKYIIENLNINEHTVKIKNGLHKIPATLSNYFDKNFKTSNSVNAEVLSVIDTLQSSQLYNKLIEQLTTAAAAHLLNKAIANPKEFFKEVEEIDVTSDFDIRRYRDKIKNFILNEHYLSKFTTQQKVFTFDGDDFGERIVKHDIDNEFYLKTSFNILKELQEEATSKARLYNVITSEEVKKLAASNGFFKAFLDTANELVNSSLVIVNSADTENVKKEFDKYSKVYAASLPEKSAVIFHDKENETKYSDNQTLDFINVSNDDIYKLSVNSNLSRNNYTFYYDLSEGRKEDALSFKYSYLNTEDTYVLMNEEQFKAAALYENKNNFIKLPKEITKKDYDTYLLVEENHSFFNNFIDSKEISFNKEIDLSKYDGLISIEYNEEENNSKNLKRIKSKILDHYKSNFNLYKEFSFKKPRLEDFKKNISIVKEENNILETIRKKAKSELGYNFLSKTSNINFPSNERGIPVSFYYQEKELYSLNQIKDNMMLQSYIARLPIGKTVYNMGKNLGIDLIKPVSAFSLTNREKNLSYIDKKDKVTNLNLGAMIFSYLPKVFEVHLEDDKEKLKTLISTIYVKNGLDIVDAKVKVKQELEKSLEKAKYLVIKNQRHVDPGMQFSSKELLVLVDKFGEDIGTLNFPSGEFYEELIENKIFDIMDYVEIEDINASTLEKLAEGLSKFIKSFKTDHIEKMELNEQNLDAILLKYIAPTFFKKGVDKNIYRQISAHLKIDEYYKTFYTPSTTNELIEEIKNDGTYDDEVKKKLLFFIEKNFLGKEVEALSTHNKKFISILHTVLENDKENLKYVENRLYKIFQDKKQLEQDSEKTIKLYMAQKYIEEQLNNLYEKKNTLKDQTKESRQILLQEYKKIKDLHSFVYQKILGLKDFQYREAMSFSTLKDKNIANSDILGWEMRTGKTRTTLAALFMQSCLNNKVRPLFFAQTKNMDDIVSQAKDMFPMFVKDMKVYDAKTSYLNKDRNIDVPVDRIDMFMPNIITQIKPEISYRFEKEKSNKADTEILIESYSEDLDILHAKIKDISFEKMKLNFKKSPYLNILDIADNHKGLEDSIKLTFMYVHKIYEEGYLSDDPQKVESVASLLEKSFRKYSLSEKKIEKLNSNALGVDLISKNFFYNMDANSQRGSFAKETFSKTKKLNEKVLLETKYSIISKIENSIDYRTYEAEREKFEEVLELLVDEYYTSPSGLDEYSSSRKALITMKSDKLSDMHSEIDVFLNKIYISSYIENKSIDIESLNMIAMHIISPHLKKEIDKNLINSPVYGVKGVMVNDTLVFDLKEFNKDFLTKEAEQLGISTNSEKFQNTLNILTNTDMQKEFATNVNRFYNINLLKAYFNPLNATVKTKIKDMSPIAYKKLRDYSSDFDFFTKTKTSKFITPPYKKKNENGDQRYSFSIIDNGYKTIDLSNLKEKVIEGLPSFEMNFKKVDSSHKIVIFKQDVLEEKVLNDMPRNTSLSSRYVLSLNAKAFSRYAVDEQHKGTRSGYGNKRFITEKTNSVTINDISRLLAINSREQKGANLLLTGTPTAGHAADIAPIISLNLPYKKAESIQKNIKTYCSIYNFTNKQDALIFSYLQDNPYSRVASFIKDIVTDSKFKYNTNGVENDIIKYANDKIKYADDDVALQVYKNISSNKLSSRLLSYADIFEHGKIKNSKSIKNKSEMTKKLDIVHYLFSNIDRIANIAPGVSNYLTLADNFKLSQQLGKVENGGTIISFSRPDNVKYEILDKKRIERNVKLKNFGKIEIDLRNISHKLLSTKLELDKYRRTYHLVEVKNKIYDIFEKFINELMREKNIDRFIDQTHFTPPPGTNLKNLTEVMNKLFSKTNKTSKDSILDLFIERLLDSSLSLDTLTDNEYKIKLLDKVTPIFAKYFNGYRDIVTEVNSALRNKDESIVFAGFEFTNLEDIAKDHYMLDGRLLIGKKYKENENVKVLNIDEKGKSFITDNKDVIPLYFKTKISLNKWGDLISKPLSIKYNIINSEDGELIDLLAVDTISDNFKGHLDEGDNIRVSSARNVILKSSFLDSLEAAINRKDKTKKLNLLINQSSSSGEDNIKSLLDDINMEKVNDANIEIRVSSSSAAFSALLKDVSKNDNEQILINSNYIALAEGVDMSMIDTGFYIGRLKAPAESIQSFARQRGNGKEISSFYLGQDYKCFEYVAPVPTDNKIVSQQLEQGINITRADTPLLIEHYHEKEVNEIVSTLDYASNGSIKKLQAYESIMEGKTPKEKFNIEKTLFNENEKYVDLEKEKSSTVSKNTEKTKDEDEVIARSI